MQHVFVAVRGLAPNTMIRLRNTSSPMQKAYQAPPLYKQTARNSAEAHSRAVCKARPRGQTRHGRRESPKSSTPLLPRFSLAFPLQMARAAQQGRVPASKCIELDLLKRPAVRCKPSPPDLKFRESHHSGRALRSSDTLLPRRVICWVLL